MKRGKDQWTNTWAKECKNLQNINRITCERPHTPEQSLLVHWQIRRHDDIAASKYCGQPKNSVRTDQSARP